MKVLTFGEIMLRLKAPGQERFFVDDVKKLMGGDGSGRVQR